MWNPNRNLEPMNVWKNERNKLITKTEQWEKGKQKQWEKIKWKRDGNKFGHI